MRESIHIRILKSTEFFLDLFIYLDIINYVFSGFFNS